jgi:hypothetical protein
MGAYTLCRHGGTAVDAELGSCRDIRPALGTFHHRWISRIAGLHAVDRYFCVVKKCLAEGYNPNEWWQKIALIERKNTINIGIAQL